MKRCSLQGTEFYRKMRIAPGLKEGKVVVLETRKQMLKELEKAANFFKVRCSTNLM